MAVHMYEWTIQYCSVQYCSVQYCSSCCYALCTLWCLVSPKVSVWAGTNGHCYHCSTQLTYVCNSMYVS